MKEAEERRFDRQLGMARLVFLLLHLVAILVNLQDQVPIHSPRPATSRSTFQKYSPDRLRVGR
jgi:hypothetical protein